jgi:GT2 family glycosyltransferase
VIYVIQSKAFHRYAESGPCRADTSMALTSASTEMSDRHFALVRLNRNAGFGEANNIGVEGANGEYIVFINNDVKISSGWVSRMLEVFDHNPYVGAVGPQFLFPDGSAKRFFNQM